MTAAAILQPTTDKVIEKKKYTLSEYLAREERSLHKHFYIDGQIIRMLGSNLAHNIIANNIGGELRIKVRPLPKKYLVCNSDQKIYIESEKTVVYSDALVICEKPEFWEGKKSLIVNPYLIVEVSSKSTNSYDRSGKFLKYESIVSFKEYILIDQYSARVESWFRTAPNTWVKTIYEGLEVEVFLFSLNISISLSDIYENIEF